MSQQAVAEKSSIHAQSIGKIERGQGTNLMRDRKCWQRGINKHIK